MGWGAAGCNDHQSLGKLQGKLAAESAPVWPSGGRCGMGGSSPAQSVQPCPCSRSCRKPHHQHCAVVPQIGNSSSSCSDRMWDGEQRWDPPCGWVCVCQGQVVRQFLFGPRSCCRAFRNPSWPDPGGRCGGVSPGGVLSAGVSINSRMSAGALTSWVSLWGALWVSQPFQSPEASPLS